MTEKFKYIGKTSFEYEIDYGLRESYQDSLRKLHPEITWESVEIGHYDGDIISIGYDIEGNWYYKNNSYGSCSGCDWIQSICTKEKAIEFYKSQENLDCLGKDKNRVKEYLRKEIQNCYNFEEKHCIKLINFVDSQGIKEFKEMI